MDALKKNRRTTHQGLWLLLLVLSTCLTSCLGWLMEAPSFVLRDINITPTSSSGWNLVLGLDVENPNRFDLTLTAAEFRIFLNGEEAGTGRLEREVLLPSSSKTKVNIMIAARFKNLGGSLKSVIAGHELAYKMEGNASIKAFFGSRRFLFSKEGRT
ncbi:MAG TPA: LEA type 2 family protein [Syntrophales bacterium]|jgi:LEA14-like dessication related protein|nr:LEA type 2 family protein [Syntrophales bacterium]